ncbi:MAG TPA: phage baseplate assembly protein V [Pyrinomonadaceae bacterium]
MSLFEFLRDDGPDAHAGRINGVVVGIVTNNQDPDGMGRVKLKFPWLSEEDESNWARVASPMAGKERGLYLLPEVEDEVLVAFEQGDVRFPYVIGSLWNGKDAPPAKNDDGKNNVRVLKSRSGHVIRLNDEEGKESVEIIDKSGKNSIRIDTADNAVTIKSDKDITLSAPNGAIKLDAGSIELKSSQDTKIEAMNLSTKSSANTQIEAGANLDGKASALMNLKGSVINLN